MNMVNGSEFRPMHVVNLRASTVVCGNIFICF